MNVFNRAKLAPTVGTLVDYGRKSLEPNKPEQWRVGSWLRILPPPGPPQSEEERIADELLAEIIAEEKAEDERKGIRRPVRVKYQFCLRNEATHVGLVGICGAIAPIEECTITGHLKDFWTEEQLASARNHAIWLGTRHEIVF